MHVTAAGRASTTHKMLSGVVPVSSLSPLLSKAVVQEAGNILGTAREYSN